MSENWQASLKRWLEAGLVDTATAERIAAFETARGADAPQGRLTMIAFAFGGILLIAGVLLFVAAHWDSLSPGSRFALVIAMVAVFHASGAVAAAKSAGLSTTLHAVGTAALGAGIFLAGQIFNIQEHWPGALMLWAIGAAVGVWLLRQWPQVVWLALLAPAWLWGEWIEVQRQQWSWGDLTPAAVGLFVLACAYLMAKGPATTESWRRALAWLGAIALIPAAAAVAWGDTEIRFYDREAPAASGLALVVAWTLAIALPLAVAWYVRRREAVWILAALAWSLILAQVQSNSDAGELAMYALFAVGAVGVVLWGLRDRQRLAINVGVLSFALAVLGFYFDNLYDKFGRSLGLIGLGVLFIGGGWLLEKTRRRLVAHASGVSP